MAKKLNIISRLQKLPQSQHGAVLLIMLVILIMGGTAMLLNALNSNSIRLERDKITADALAQAKDALIGYAVKVSLTNSSATQHLPRPGDLPCPDTNNDGITDSPCGNAEGTTGQSLRLGRLPWKTLGLPDLRDGSGERLWYAVSNNFKEHWNTTATFLNSDTAGTITVRDSIGNILYNGCTTFSPNCPLPSTSDAPFGTGAVAIIIAPGDVLQRTDKTSQQDRSTSGSIITDNYLDIANGEDNSNFTDSTSNGFIQGRIKDANDKVILNDQILAITQENIMLPIQKRVAGEVRNCLVEYALNNNGRFPWAAPLTELGSTYNDKDNELFGRIPDELSDTKDSASSMADEWGVCTTHSAKIPSTWWKNWKEQVFYGLSDKYSPDNSPAPSFPSTCTGPGNCISINNSSTPAKFVVIVAGKKLANPDQSLRDASSANRSDAYYFLEAGNQSADQTGAYTYIQSPPSDSYNDTVAY